MARRKAWSIASTSSQQMGRMKCCQCSKQITEGEYLWRDTEEAYITLHKECSLNQPIWQAREIARQAYAWAGVNP